MKTIDLRSDTVTLPSQEIRDAISNAKLGDDVFQEDPNVNLLESEAALIAGKEAALLVPSGTMGNLISFLVHCQRGTEAILGNKSHTFIYEAGGISSMGGIHSHQLQNTDDGMINLDLIKNAIRKDNVHFPVTSLISLENTHNMCYGSPITKDYIDEVATIAKNNNLKLHIDGARIFNATINLNIELKKLIEHVDSVTFCLSKGLAVIEGNAENDLSQFPNNSFDYVVLGQTLQAFINPEAVIRELLRVGKKAIVTIPNFGHWKVRLNLLVKGTMPITKSLPNSWYNTPNLHMCTIKDFFQFSKIINFRIFKSLALINKKVSNINNSNLFFKNLFGELGIFLIEE